MVYLDASALLKLFLDEDGTPEVRALWVAPVRAVAARVAYVECSAALAAAERLGRFDADGRNEARAELDRHWAELDVIELTEAVARIAAEAATSAELRALAAIHLASALSIPRGDLVFATWDRRLHAAAAATFDVAPARLH